MTTCCMGCLDRSPGCHSCCGKYAQYRAKREQANANHRAAVESRLAMLDTRSNLAHRVERAKGLRR